jgi:hypothetical protein
MLWVPSGSWNEKLNHSTEVDQEPSGKKDSPSQTRLVS